MGYLKETYKGISWMGGLRIAVRTLGYIRIAILARLLVPSEFGVFGIASLVLALLEILTETGINVILIQEKDRLEDYVDTAWLVSVARGILMFLALFLGAPFISGFFNSSESLSVLRLIAFVPLIKGFINPSRVKFQKELQFNKEFLISLVIYFVDAFTAVTTAFLTKSAISIVFGLLVGGVTEVILSFIFIKPRPSLRKLNFENIKARSIISRGKWVTAFGILDYLFANVDNMTIGKVMNTAALGIYQNAYTISTLPLTEISVVFNQVTFPIFTKIADDLERLKKAYFKTTLIVICLVLPFSLLLFLFPKEIVLIVLGNKWLEAVKVLKILAIFGAIRGVINYGYTLFLARRKQEYVTYCTFIGILGIGVTVIPFVKTWGLVGAAYAAFIGTILTIPFFLYFLRKVLSSSNG